MRVGLLVCGGEKAGAGIEAAIDGGGPKCIHVGGDSGVRPGGGIAVSAFHAPFAIRHLESGESFDPATGVLHEVATLRNEAGEERPFDLWTTCFTARELTLLAAVHGVEVLGVHGVTPGRYGATPPSLDDPELLLVGRRR